jgi:hypothetical protein
VTDESADHILQSVRDHFWTYTTAPVSKDPAHRPQNADHRCPCETLIGMSPAERQRRKDNANRYTPGQRNELLLQVAAVNGLFANAGRD